MMSTGIALIFNPKEDKLTIPFIAAEIADSFFFLGAWGGRGEGGGVIYM